MHDLLTKAVEAGARGLANAEGWDFDNMPKPARSEYLGRAEAALRAALPGILEAVVGVAEARAEAADQLGYLNAKIIAANIREGAAAQRALVAQILEGE